MDSKDVKELNSIKSELQSIINELDDITSTIRSSATNVGESQAALCISEVADKYRGVKKTLNKIKT